jgi:tetratricopeptide (TPR) repeat protein
LRKFTLYILYFLLTYDIFHLIYRILKQYNLANLGYDFFSVIRDLILIWLIIKLNRPKKKLTKFDHFHREAFNAEERQEYEKALQIREEGLRLTTLTNLQRAELYFGNGGTYLYLNDYENATNYFDKAFELTKHEKFPYDDQYVKVIESYVKANRKNDAIHLVEDLLKRQTYNKKFKKLELIKDRLLM